MGWYADPADATTAARDDPAIAMDPDRYLARLGLDPEHIRERARDPETLTRIQEAHVTTVPFETLAITGDPVGDREGEGVSLALPDLYEKVVERRRGGFCFELNGLFGWLLAELGFDAHRAAAMMLGDGDDPGPPANHHVHVASLDRRYVVDVGMGVPPMRRPLPLDGAVVTDAAGVAWRVVDSGRPDAEHLVQQREPGEDGWADRYVLDDAPRTLDYFAATCEYLATAPESSFTGDPVVSMATVDGWTKLKPGTLARVADGERREQSVAADEFHDLLDDEFGLRYRPE